MHDKEKIYFELLKKEVVQKFRELFPGASEQIQDWKGQTIHLFQDDLFEKVNQNISEKWFYNHMKTSTDKLPRIDMLNILSRYCGYVDWQDFIYRHRETSGIALQGKKANPNKIFIYVSLLTLLTVAIIYIFYSISSTRNYQFCFINADDRSSIRSENIKMELFQQNESPLYYNSDSTGCIEFWTNTIKCQFVITAPYYKRDTITRMLKKYKRHETIPLHVDDYALMLHYYSASDVVNWKKRKRQLNQIFHDNAIIYEVLSAGNTGIEIYDKKEFIEKLMIPISSNKELDIIDIIYNEGKISKLRFSSK